MVLSAADVSDLYSRLPQLRRLPSAIYVVDPTGQTGGVIETQGNPYQYESTQMHALNADIRSGAWVVRGMHPAGSPTILVAGSAPPSTYVHEAVHGNGPLGGDFPNEQATRIRTTALLKVAPFMPAIMRRPVRYVAQPVTGGELENFLRENRLTLRSGSGVVEKYVRVRPMGQPDLYWLYGGQKGQWDSSWLYRPEKPQMDSVWEYRG